MVDRQQLNRLSYFLQLLLTASPKPRKEGTYKDKEELLSLNNKEQERENKLEKDNFKEEGGLRQMLLIKAGKEEGRNGEGECSG